MLRGFLDIFFPRDCIECHTPCGRHEHFICAQCWEQLPRIEAPRCITCARGFDGAVEDATVRCPGCIELDPAFEAGLSLFKLEGPARTCVHTLKYHHGLFLKKDLARIVAATPELSSWVEDATLVPVPLHKKRQRARGFNQSTFLAEAFSQAAPCKGVVPLLERIRATPPQTHLNRKERSTNVRNAFALNSKLPFDKQGAYLLVDDVYTTGATLQACARVLRQAGAHRVRILTFAHG